jgi:flagellar basal-body rod protein FlgB
MLTPVAGRLERYLDLLAERQKLVASNIANIDTPGYLTKDIDFQFEFIAAEPGGAPRAIEPEGLSVKSDGNNVSLERETRLLAENALRFNAASNLLRGEIRIIRKAIEEGRGA